VGVDDLFLFFGWFKDANVAGGRWAFTPGSSDRHILFGWLQIETVLNCVTSSASARDELLNTHSWLQWHPNLSAAYLGDPINTIYIAKSWLFVRGVPVKTVPGAGLFASSIGPLDPKFVLTDSGQAKRSVWRLRNWGMTSTKIPPLSFHTDPARWRLSGSDWILQTVGRGQEFVLEISLFPDVERWLASLFI
jgi:hypothetical protein